MDMTYHLVMNARHLPTLPLPTLPALPLVPALPAHCLPLAHPPDQGSDPSWNHLEIKTRPAKWLASCRASLHSKSAVATSRLPGLGKPREAVP